MINKGSEVFFLCVHFYSGSFTCGGLLDKHQGIGYSYSSLGQYGSMKEQFLLVCLMKTRAC